jgi:uncharacterized protein YlxP (DUF503 family)
MTMIHPAVVTAFLTAVLLTGCTRSLEYTYQPAVARLAGADKAAQMSIGVAKFSDKRSWIDAKDDKGRSYIAQQSPWKFALTHEAREYIPVDELLQTLFVRELANAGFQARPLDSVASKATAPALRDEGAKAGTTFVLGGDILVFEFVNEQGFWAVTSRRAVTLALYLARVNDGQPVVDSTFTEMQREGEGMGVLHTTNADKLMNGVLKTVIQRVVAEVAQKLEISAADVSVRLAILTRRAPPRSLRWGRAGTPPARS